MTTDHTTHIARDQCLAPERVDAPIYGGRYRRLFEDVPALDVDEHAPANVVGGAVVGRASRLRSSQ